MKLYKKIIPRIAKDIIAELTLKNYIEIENGKMEEAELDITAIIVEYVNNEKKIHEQAKQIIAKRGFEHNRFYQIKKNIASSLGYKIESEALDFILNQIIEGFFASRNIAEIFGKDNDIRKTAKIIIDKYLLIPEELDKEARKYLKNINEGTAEWSIEYPRIISILKRRKDF